MDGSRFAHLTRVLVTGGSRRRFLGGLAALAAGAVTHSALAVSCPPDQVYRQKIG